MKLPGIIVIVIALAQSALAGWKDLHLVNGCTVFTASGEHVETFPGNICLFFDDGSVVSSGNTALKLFDKSGAITWEIPGHFHHQINLTEKKDRILALGSDTADIDGTLFRIDVFYVISREGKIIFRQRADELFAQAGLKLTKLNTDPRLLKTTGAKSEFSHFNSFHEIPELTAKVPADVSRSRYVVNSLTSGVFFLSEDLTKVIRHFRIPTSEDHQIHDVQVTPAGSLFFFNNLVAGGREFDRWSAVQEAELGSLKIIREFTASPKPFFHVFAGGGAQRLDERHWLFADMLHASYVYDVVAAELVSTITKTHYGPARRLGLPTFQIKAYDLRPFFRSRTDKEKK